MSGDARLNLGQDVGIIRNTIVSDDDPRASAPTVTFAPGQRVLRRRSVTVTAASRVTGTLSATGTIAVPRRAAGRFG